MGVAGPCGNVDCESMTAILVVESDSGVCDLIADVLRADLAADVQCASTGTLGAKALQSGNLLGSDSWQRNCVNLRTAGLFWNLAG
jgi:hypothetical protein